MYAPTEKRQRGDVHAIRTARPACLVGQHDGDEQSESERRDGEIVSFELENRPAHRESYRAREYGADEQAQPRRRAEMDWADGDGIRADTEKAGMTQADLTGKAHEQIEAHDRQRENENKRTDPIVIRRREERRQDNDDCSDQYRRQQSRFEQRAHAHTRSTLDRPNRPCGMTTKTTRMIRKATASL